MPAKLSLSGVIVIFGGELFFRLIIFLLSLGLFLSGSVVRLGVGVNNFLLGLFLGLSLLCRLLSSLFVLESLLFCLGYLEKLCSRSLFLSLSLLPAKLSLSGVIVIFGGELFFRLIIFLLSLGLFLSGSVVRLGVSVNNFFLGLFLGFCLLSCLLVLESLSLCLVNGEKLFLLCLLVESLLA